MKKFLNFLRSNKYSIFYFFLLCIITALIIFIIPKDAAKVIFDSLENKTFDIRQRIISKDRKPNKDIVIVSIDDPSYEYLIETYGEWPIPRYVYAQLLDYIQTQNPKYVVFDLLFIKSLHNVPGSDKKLIDAFKKYPNAYTAVNFDYYSAEVRKPADLDDKIKTRINIESETIDPYEFTNCRQILKGLEVHGNIGHINTFKSDDGFVRQIPVFVRYKNDNYLYLTVKLALDYLNKYEHAGIDEIKIDKDNNLIMGSRKIPMSVHGEAVLNWYGKNASGASYQYIPMWKAVKSMTAVSSGSKALLDENTFKDKIVYIGTSVFSLSDIKTTPVSAYMPGVEIHASLLNNIIDNIIIKNAPLAADIAVSIILAAISALLAFKIRSVYASLMSLIILLGFYLYLSVFAMLKYNLWIWVVIPAAAALAVFALSYIIKYLIASRDFEHMYKLAATDGLTELYNHRFFQEQLRKQIKIADKTKTSFALIMTDIDFFKKFNDNYGHQAGDAVLKYTAKTLKAGIRRQDYACRYGGEEMAVILCGADRTAAVKTAQNLCKTIAEKKFPLADGLEVQITISLGVSAYPLNGSDAAELIEYADKCLYAAKENGRNQVGFIE